MAMDPVVVAVDVGSGYVKGVAGLRSDSPRVSFPSVVGVVQQEMRGSFGFEDIPVIEYRGKTWMTGQWAMENLRRHQTADTLSHAWAGSDAWKVLLFRALFELGVREGEVHLVTGLPQVDYQNRRQEVLSSILDEGEHRPVVHGTPLHIRVVRNAGMVIPQAAAGLYYWSARDPQAKEILRQDAVLGGIDVGTYTTGFAVLRGSQPVPDKSGGFDLGMARVAETLAGLLHTQYGISLDRNGAMQMLEKRHKVFLDGEFRDISSLVSRSVSLVISPLLDMLYGKWGEDARGMYIGMYGGGARDFLPHIQTAFPGVRMVDFPETGGGRYLPALGMMVYFASRNGWEIGVS